MKIFEYLALASWLIAGAAEVRGDELGGIGVVLGVKGSNIVVKSIVPDSPAAAQKDIHVGDRIMAVAQDKEPAVQVQSGKLKQAVDLIRGLKGTTVRLTIVPAGEDMSRVQVVSLVRGELKQLRGDGVLLPKGSKAPDIEMIGLANGASERLSDYGGKIVLLEFWATWCGPCQIKMAELQSYAGKHPAWKDKVILIAASVDDNPDAVIKYLKAKGWDQTQNVWVGTDAIKACHIEGIPAAYVIDRQGRIVAANPEDLPESVDLAVQTKQGSEEKQRQ
jgi:thiol-disulfide isomerase/thioredoxin